jgi:glutaredoxin 3
MLARFLVYTKPECPFCVSAKSLLDEKGLSYSTVSLETADERTEFLKKLGGWGTFPVIFETDSSGTPVRFVGGFDSLSKELA